MKRQKSPLLSVVHVPLVRELGRNLYPLTLGYRFPRGLSLPPADANTDLADAAATPPDVPSAHAQRSPVKPGRRFTLQRAQPILQKAARVV